jgi:hypothetical protein
MNVMGDKMYDFQNQADELRHWSDEIDELQSKVTKVEFESGPELNHQSVVLRTNLETARDKLINIFISIRNQDPGDGENKKTNSTSGR